MEEYGNIGGNVPEMVEATSKIRQWGHQHGRRLKVIWGRRVRQGFKQAEYCRSERGHRWLENCWTIYLTFDQLQSNAKVGTALKDRKSGRCEVTGRKYRRCRDEQI
jgi:hypothetical protein